MIPTPRELQEAYPLEARERESIDSFRRTIEAIFEGKDPRTLCIVGPCSIHDREAALAYAEKLASLARELSDELFLVMRVYIEKPRTIRGWKGYLYDPGLDGTHEIAKGLAESRELLVQIAKMKLPIASELLEINTFPYLQDLYSWGCIGARTSASPPHRQIASSLDFPIGIKNSVDGNIDIAIHGVLSAASPHVFLAMNEDGRIDTRIGEGNPHCHIILRGSLEGPNYDPESIQSAGVKLERASLSPRLLVDCSHDNSRKNPLNQIPAFEAVLRQIQEGSPYIAGFMLESHLEGGNQFLPSASQYGVSITDPCLDWVTTERLLREAASLALV